jgi:hypothetical protein
VPVGADNLAFRDLIEDALPVSAGELVSDFEGLVVEVIELEDYWIRFAAVRAWVVAEVLKKELGSRLPSFPLSTSFGIDVLPPIRQVVLTPICRSAAPTHVVPLALLQSPPRELVDRLR